MTLTVKKVLDSVKIYNRDKAEKTAWIVNHFMLFPEKA